MLDSIGFINLYYFIYFRNLRLKKMEWEEEERRGRGKSQSIRRELDTPWATDLEQREQRRTCL